MEDCAVLAIGSAETIPSRLQRIGLEIFAAADRGTGSFGLATPASTSSGRGRD